MATSLILHIVGAGAFVPHLDGKALLAVLPNATGLGRSPAGAHDGFAPARHLPVLWENQVDSNGVTSYGTPRIFPGARLSFELNGTFPGLDLAAISPHSSQGWLPVDPAVMTAMPDARVSGQVLITAGTVTPYTQIAAMTCYSDWSSGKFKQSLAPVVGGLTVKTPGVTSVTARADRWVTTSPAITPKEEEPMPLFHRDLKDGDTVELFLGNCCAEDILDWPRNSVGNKSRDSDFKWIYGLTRPDDIGMWVRAGLPVPVIQGGPIDADMDPLDAFAACWGGGGGAGCECNGLVTQPSSFQYTDEEKHR
jgi:hypothetical protein